AGTAARGALERIRRGSSPEPADARFREARHRPRRARTPGRREPSRGRNRSVRQRGEGRRGSGASCSQFSRAEEQLLFFVARLVELVDVNPVDVARVEELVVLIVLVIALVVEIVVRVITIVAAVRSFLRGERLLRLELFEALRPRNPLGREQRIF